ncbi:MAG TPA: group II intron reverse transcriptase/maturase [Acidobacteriaceae bacterium]|jgi:group II intron reverse transcriptase/maturase|nr:group II intron reverse transcriptase/maturase [Acidobacteriaceae bacterium]
MARTEEGRRNLSGAGSGAESGTAAAGRTKPEALRLMEAVVERSNLLCAYERVVKNEGAPGVDGLTVTEFKPWLQAHWPSVRQAMLAGDYMPAAVRKVEIPKPQGGVRTLGIPTVLDRLIQQSLNQVLQPLFDPEFSESSYGFRPGRNAHQAVKAAQSYVAEGKRWVVDLDLEKFFDRVNHDVLMARVVRKVKDERVLKLIRRYLEAGLMEGGITSMRTEGTPQGGPLSPLLSNILLDDLDRELERRGLSFCRYADDCNIYVGSKRAGERVMQAVTAFLERRLKLKVNASKSAVARPWERKFLGYSMTWHKKPKLKIAQPSRERLAEKIRKTLREARGESLKRAIERLNPVLRGWVAYFRLTEVKGVLEELDGWIRRKLRVLMWRQWKRGYTRAKNLMRAGLGEARSWQSATNGHGPWWNGGASHMNLAYPKSWFDRMGLVSLLDMQQRFPSAS